MVFLKISLWMNEFAWRALARALGGPRAPPPLLSPPLPFIGLGRGEGGGFSLTEIRKYGNTENNSIQWNETAATERGRREQPASTITVNNHHINRKLAIRPPSDDPWTKFAKIPSDSTLVTCIRMSWPNLVKIGCWKADGMSWFGQQKPAVRDASASSQFCSHRADRTK